jgi:hypothetical protein
VHGATAVTIIVNGEPHEVEREAISFADVIALAFSSPPSGPNVIFSVTYRRGHGAKPQGILTEGETVRVKAGMIFDVTVTDKS